MGENRTGYDSLREHTVSDRGTEWHIIDRMK